MNPVSDLSVLGLPSYAVADCDKLASILGPLEFSNQYSKFWQKNAWRVIYQQPRSVFTGTTFHTPGGSRVDLLDLISDQMSWVSHMRGGIVCGLDIYGPADEEKISWGQQSVIGRIPLEWPLECDLQHCSDLLMGRP